jgi:hypothetical protein
MHPILRKTRLAALLFAVSLLAACATPVTDTGFNYQQYLVGLWSTEINDFPVTVEYTDATVVIVGFGEPVPYTMAGDRISFEFEGPQTSTIAMVSQDEMNQTNLTTQQITVYKRVK